MPTTKQPTQTSHYANWLNTMSWDCFCTLGASYPMKLPAARRAATRLKNFLQKHYGDVTLFFVAEPYQDTKGYHLHALIKFTSAINLEKLKELLHKAWQIVTGGGRGKNNNRTAVEPYDASMGAHHYVSKFILRGDVDWDLFY